MDVNTLALHPPSHQIATYVTLHTFSLNHPAENNAATIRRYAASFEYYVASPL
jgi:RAB protein geranylgeranyltransferase component A